MDRIRLIAGSHRWLLLAALSLLALALGTAMFSGASFSSKSANSASLATASIQLHSSVSGQILDASKMKPGDSRQGTISIGNEGEVPGVVSLKASGLTGTALAAVLDLKIEETTSKATQLWTGKLGTFSELSLGSFAVDSPHTYRITLSWPSASNEASLQGAATSLTFQWNGVSKGS